MENTKTAILSALKLKQLFYEITGWKRTLVNMMEENIHLKSRLAEILNIHLHQQLLVQIEGFQNNFLQHDSLIGLLRNDIASFERSLNIIPIDDQTNFEDIQGKLYRIRTNVGLAETQFDLLKTEFNCFVLDNI